MRECRPTVRVLFAPPFHKFRQPVFQRNPGFKAQYVSSLDPIRKTMPDVARLMPARGHRRRMVFIQQPAYAFRHVPDGLGPAAAYVEHLVLGLGRFQGQPAGPGGIMDADKIPALTSVFTKQRGLVGEIAGRE